MFCCLLKCLIIIIIIIPSNFSVHFRPRCSFVAGRWHFGRLMIHFIMVALCHSLLIHHFGYYILIVWDIYGKNLISCTCNVKSHAPHEQPIYNPSCHAPKQQMQEKDHTATLAMTFSPATTNNNEQNTWFRVEKKKRKINTTQLF